jgi:methanogenic corrinoid protein MtbC1
MDEAGGGEPGWDRTCEIPGLGRGSTHGAANLPAGQDWQAFDSLVKAIETEIIPRLMLAHRPAGVPLTGRGSAELAAESEVVEFTERLLDRDENVALEYVRAKRNAGVEVDALFLRLFSAAARRLGELWVEDLCSFAEVTVGVSRLHGLVRELSPAFHHASHAGYRNRRALLVPTPGEQHTFGLFMLSEFFRRDGWDVSGESGGQPAEVAARAERDWFDLVGLSLSGERLIDPLRETIVLLRKLSCNPRLVVMVGGALFLSRPELVGDVGADSSATDAPAALATAERLIRALPVAHPTA